MRKKMAVNGQSPKRSTDDCHGISDTRNRRNFNDCRRPAFRRPRTRAGHPARQSRKPGTSDPAYSASSGYMMSQIQASLPSTTPLIPPSQPGVLPTPPTAMQLTTLLGSVPSDHMRILHSLYASQIATIVWLQGSTSAEGSRRSVVVGLALKPLKDADDTEITDRQRKTFHGIMEMLQQLLQQKDICPSAAS